MPKTRQQKAGIKERLVKEFKDAKSVIFADYQGMTVAQATDLRKKTREANVDYIVAKKSLFTLAAKEAGFDLVAKQFPGMLGAAFGKGDEIAPAKVLGDMTKGTTLKLVGGIFEGITVGQEKVVALSKLPSKKELLGMVVGTMYAPVSAFVRALNAIRESREAGASASVAALVVEAVQAPVAEAPAAAPAV
jgi:large subunit ribosomal protein L10